VPRTPQDQVASASAVCQHPGATAEAAGRLHRLAGRQAPLPRQVRRRRCPAALLLRACALTLVTRRPARRYVELWERRGHDTLALRPRTSSVVIPPLGDRQAADALSAVAAAQDAQPGRRTVYHVFRCSKCLGMSRGPACFCTGSAPRHVPVCRGWAVVRGAQQCRLPLLRHDAAQPGGERPGGQRDAPGGLFGHCGEWQRAGGRQRGRRGRAAARRAARRAAERAGPCHRAHPGLGALAAHPRHRCQARPWAGAPSICVACCTRTGRSCAGVRTMPRPQRHPRTRALLRHGTGAHLPCRVPATVKDRLPTM